MHTILLLMVAVILGFDWAPFSYLIQPLVGVVTLGLAGVIVHAIKTPKDHERAVEIGLVAHDIATAVVAETGGAPWAVILQRTIDQLRDSIPTASADTARRAATAALIRAGAKK